MDFLELDAPIHMSEPTNNLMHTCMHAPHIGRTINQTKEQTNKRACHQTKQGSRPLPCMFRMRSVASSKDDSTQDG